MTNSSWEDYLENQIIAAGLPAPTREYRFLKTRRFRLDLAWPLFNFGVEIHGAVYSGGRHTTGSGFSKDREKMNLLTLEGWRYLECTTPQVGQGIAIDWIKTYFAAVKKRFDNKVIQQDGCWQWAGSLDGKGYGMFGICTCPHEPKIIRAHRVSFIFANKTIKDGNHVLHSCDNPGCVNPEHLREGTHQENMKDRDYRDRGKQTCKFKKGRKTPAGEESPTAKLKNKDVIKIRKLLNDNYFTHKEIAEKFKVHRSTVTAINNNRIRKTG